MIKIVKFNTACGSNNMGDYIINESVDNELNEVFKGNFVVNYSTHSPVATWYQCSRKSGIMKYCNSAKYKFIAGTNLLSNNMLRPWPNWNVNIFNYKPYKNAILVGCGSNGKFKKANLYTKILYKKILSKEYIHSTRDEKTKVFIESLGLKAVNTGCATLWKLTKEFCKQIPTTKSDNVVFTLTDYCKDNQKDQALIDILIKEYNSVSYWVQGSRDYDYLKSLKNTENIKVIFSLKEYNDLLNGGNIDFVGTRLHAGIYAMQHKVRSIIIAIDNRTRDMRETYNLVTIERENIINIDKLINSEFETNIKIDEGKISSWKSQFINGANNE